MPKSRSKNRIFILGCIIIGVTGLLLIYGLLVVTGVIHLKENKLIFTAESASRYYDGRPLQANKWELTSGSLMSGHYVVARVTGSITEPGVVNSTVSVNIYDGNDVDVTDEYEIQCVSGTLQIFGRKLVLMSGSSTKLYDGSELTNSKCEILEGSLMVGHKITLEAIGSITDIGKTPNTIKYAIVDGSGGDVARFYEIVKQEGALEIQKIPYAVKTDSDTKLYDGTPLTCDGYIDYGTLLDGHKATVRVDGKIVGEGTVFNTATVKITDEKGKDVTYLYDINISMGKLTVVGPPRKEDDGTEDGSDDKENGKGTGESSIDDSMSGSDLNNPSNDNENKEDVEVFRVTSTKTGRILFRMNTFGDYNYHGWKDAPIETDPSALYYTSREMMMNGVDAESVTVESILDMGYLLPYYADESTVNTALRKYTVEYMPYNHLTSPITDLIETDTERSYRIFVYMNYTALPSDTKEAMLELLAEQGLDTSDMTVIEQVAWVENYIKHAATYNLFYKPYPDIVDTAIYFLTEAKEGVCRHFAASATVALRALGIPARYTVGFAADIEHTNTPTVVTGDKAHAWVEVYIDSLGWIAIDPTGAAPSNGSGDIEEGEGGGDIELEGTLPSKGSGGSGGGGGGGSIKPFMTFVAESDGSFYFRQKHFGSYSITNGWLPAPADEDAHSYTLATEALKGAYGSYTVNVTPVSNMRYLIPYYTDKSTIAYFDGITPYSLSYSLFDIMTAQDIPYLSADMAEYELGYRDFVYSSYLDLPESTRAEMLEFIARAAAESGVELSSVSRLDVIRWVVSYISANAIVDKNFPEFPEGADMAVWFIAESRTGVGAHFATSATVMLRALGIPARYTMGYKAQAQAGESAKINALMFASWVEVYLDGFGWVVIDPTDGARYNTAGGGSSGAIGNEKPKEDEKPKDVFEFNANVDGTLYFRDGYYGNYIPGYGWDGAPAGEDISHHTLIAKALSGMGKICTVTVTPTVQIPYLSVYYPFEIPYGDYDGASEYSAYFYYYDYLKGGSPSQSGAASELEKSYREYVYANFTALPESTRSAMLDIAKQIFGGANVSEMDRRNVIIKVRDYIKNAKKYDLQFSDFPEGVDAAVYFLTEAESGVCRHFATSATAMYRALGIPARYATGYMATAVSGETVQVNSMSAHAWVEVYIDGLGWIVVDPTGSSGGSGGQPDDSEDKIKITLLPNSMEKEFDGTPLTAEDASHKIKDNVRLYGKDQLIVVYGGEVTMPGETVGYIVSCRAEDENGNDVSYRYEFDISATSVLKVTKRELKVYSEDSVKIHDGEPLTCPYLEEGYERKLLPGHFLSVEFSGNQTDIGMGENIFTAKVVDELGNEIPEWQEMYKLEKVYGCLKVVYSFLIFETNSISKEYDGSPLRADGECRYVGGELLEGHYIESAVTNQSRTEPGTTLNRPTVVIRDQDGNDVSYMYDLAEEKMGVIRVNRIKLKITSGSVEIRFDPSNPHAMLKCEEYTCEGAVLSDHRVNVMISVYLDSVGECDNQIDFVTVTDSRGRDVSGYYDIETENGTLKILPPVS